MASDDAQRDADARRMLGRQLREFRTKAKRSQRECAELAGIGRVAWTLIAVHHLRDPRSRDARGRSRCHLARPSSAGGVVMFSPARFAKTWSNVLAEADRENAAIAEDDARYGALTSSGHTRLGAPSVDDDEDPFLEQIDNRFADTHPVHAGAGENA